MVAKTFKSPAIASGGSWIIDPTGETDTAMNKSYDSWLAAYAPFDSVFVINESLSDIDVTINEVSENKISIKPGKNKTVDDDSILIIIVHNTGSSNINANDIEVTIGKEIQTDQSRTFRGRYF